MAIAREAKTEDATGSVGTGGSQTFSHTHPTGLSDDILLVSVQQRSSTANNVITGVTYGGQALTKLDNESHNPGTTFGIYCSVWYLVAPPTGANDVVASADNGWRGGAVAISYSGVDQTTPWGTPVTGSGSSSTTFEVTVSSASGEVIVDAIVIYDDDEDRTLTVGSGQTEVAQFVGGSGASSSVRCANSEEDGAASVDMTWTCVESTSEAHVAAPLKPASAGTTKTLQLSDQLDFSDTAIGLQVKAPGFSDQMDLTDVLDVAGVRAVLASDQVDLTDLLSVRGVRSVQPADSLDLSDTLTVKIAGVTITLVPSDQLDLSDQIKVPRKTRIQF